MWSAVHFVLNAPFDGFFWLVQWLPAGRQIAVLALPAVIFALLIYKKVSEPGRHSGCQGEDHCLSVFELRPLP